MASWMVAVLVMTTVSSIGCGRSASEPAPPPIAGNWTLRLNDEFTTLDTTRCVQRYWWKGDTFWPTNELEVYRPANVTANGVLTLTARRESELVRRAGQQHAVAVRAGRLGSCLAAVVA
jgi:hypothetical protein